MVGGGTQRASFQREKAIEMVLYLARRLQEPTLLRICKLMYFADKRHLDDWGQFLCGNEYVAMEHGPVPIDIYEMLVNAREAGSEAFNLREVDGKPFIQPLREAKPELLSEAATQTLDWALREYGALRIGKLYEIAHEEAAWIRAWNEESSQRRFPMPVVSIAASLPDSDALVAHLRGED